jgi:hypothetical protein
VSAIRCLETWNSKPWQLYRFVVLECQVVVLKELLTANKTQWRLLETFLIDHTIRTAETPLVSATMIGCDGKGYLLDGASLPLDLGTTPREEQSIDPLEIRGSHATVG